MYPYQDSSSLPNEYRFLLIDITFHSLAESSIGSDSGLLTLER